MGHFKQNTLHSLAGDPLKKYAQGKDHFLFRLNDTIDWDEFTPKLLEAYKGKARLGESPYHPLILFKMLLLAYLLNTSERAIEEQCYWFIPVRLFVGLGIYDAVPDHSTLTLFKQRLQKHSGIDGFKAIFDGIIKQALEKGVRFGSMQIVDSVHTVANVNNDRDRERHDQPALARRPGGKPSADPDATVVHKGKRLVTRANGMVEQQELMHLGYKTHVSQDAETGIVTSIKPTTGCSADNQQFLDLVKSDTELGVTADTYTADKGKDLWRGQAMAPAWPGEIPRSRELPDTVLHDVHGDQSEADTLAAGRGEAAPSVAPSNGPGVKRADERVKTGAKRRRRRPRPNTRCPS